jgi:predicted phosphodiesterase
MRILVLSDIHANLAAFEAVLKAVEGQWDRIWFLGDLVGYGPKPNECITLLREFDHLSLSGNHDWAVLGKLNISEFNEDARAVVLWTRSVLEPESRNYLESLPPKRVVDEFTLAHASPRQPVWEYILDYDTAAANFAHFDTPCCLVGHSHIPLHIIEQKPGDLVIKQVALLDSENLTWQFGRVPYPIEETQEQMRQEDFPPALIERLSFGW